LVGDSELFHEAPQVSGEVVELLRRLNDFFDPSGRFVGHLRNGLHTFRNLVPRGGLLLGCGGNAVDAVGNVSRAVYNLLERIGCLSREFDAALHFALSLLDGLDGLGRILLDGRHHLFNFVGGLGGTFGQFADFLGDDCKPLSRFS